MRDDRPHNVRQGERLDPRWLPDRVRRESESNRLCSRDAIGADDAASHAVGAGADVPYLQYEKQLIEVRDLVVSRGLSVAIHVQLTDVGYEHDGLWT